MYIVDATSVSHTRETSTILSNDFNNTYACVHVLDDAHVDLCIFPKKNSPLHTDDELSFVWLELIQPFFSHMHVTHICIQELRVLYSLIREINAAPFCPVLEVRLSFSTVSCNGVVLLIITSNHYPIRCDTQICK